VSGCQPESRRFDLAPLAVDLGIVWNAPGPTTERCEELAGHIGVSQSYIRQLRRKGLSEAQADRFAIRAGTHPQVVWGRGWSDLDEAEAEVEAA
jgi:hypothetical protein